MTARCALVGAARSCGYAEVDPMHVLSVQDIGLQAHLVSRQRNRQQPDTPKQRLAMAA